MAEKRKPNILLHDIEAGPNLGYVYGKYDQTVIEFEHEWDLMAYGFKWLGRRAVESYAQDEYTELDLLEIAHEKLSEADVVVAHNGDRFDTRKLNAKFLDYGFNPPAPYKSIDTLKVAKRHFMFNSNRLGDLAERLDVDRKAQLGGFAVWRACLDGDQKAFDKLKRYNRQDVRVLEGVYLQLRPWMDNHPAMNILTGNESACPKCGEDSMKRTDSVKVNKTTTYDIYQCGDCGGFSQARKPNRTDVEFTN